jgi:hypothetical protein
LYVRTPNSSHQAGVRPIRREDILMIYVGFPIHGELATEGSMAFLINNRGVQRSIDAR